MKKLSKYLRFSWVMVLFVAVMTVNAYGGVSLPTANMNCHILTDANGLSLSASTTISKVNYQDNTSVTTSADDSIIGSAVTITGATRTAPGALTFNDATIVVEKNGYVYVNAQLINIVLSVFPGGKVGLNENLDAANPGTLNLVINSLSQDASHPSRFITEWLSALNGSTSAGMLILADLTQIGIDPNTYEPIYEDPSGVSDSNITTGLLDGSPVGAPPLPSPGVRSMGYWKTHTDERAAFLPYTSSTVFSTQTELESFVTMKGRKCMVEKAKQQLAALLLNVAAGLDPATDLTVSQLENTDPSTVTTVGQAIDDIETVILSAPQSCEESCTNTCKTELERVKDLAESINTNE